MNLESRKIRLILENLGWRSSSTSTIDGQAKKRGTNEAWTFIRVLNRFSTPECCYRRCFLMALAFMFFPRPERGCISYTQKICKAPFPCRRFANFPSKNPWSLLTKLLMEGAWKSDPISGIFVDDKFALQLDWVVTITYWFNLPRLNFAGCTWIQKTRSLNFYQV